VRDLASKIREAFKLLQTLRLPTDLYCGGSRVGCNGALGAIYPGKTQATRLLLQPVSIGQEVGSCRFRPAQARKSQILAQPGAGPGFRVRFALVRWRLCSMLQTPGLPPLPLLLRWIASCVLDLIVQEEFSPSPAEIEISHVVY
jgi:hypothetical protein